MARGKSRLAAALDPTERMRLNRQLVRHALGLVARALGTTAHCIVVSPCRRSLTLARAAAAIPMQETRPGRGLNAAVRQALRFARQQGAARTLILPTDLPLASAASIASLLRAARSSARFVIVPDRDKAGTNALLLPVRAAIEPRFGADSFRRHADAAREAGRSHVVVEIPALMQDLDTPEHLRAWIAAGRAWGR